MHLELKKLKNNPQWSFQLALCCIQLPVNSQVVTERELVRKVHEMRVEEMMSCMEEI